METACAGRLDFNRGLLEFDRPLRLSALPPLPAALLGIGSLEFNRPLQVAIVTSSFTSSSTT